MPEAVSELAGDEELRMDGTGDDPMCVSIHKQLTKAGIVAANRVGHFGRA